MPKIRVELEVPNDVFRPCETCRYYRQDRFDWGYCYLFEQKISYGHRCEQCKQAEIKDTTKSCKECIYRNGKMCNLYGRELAMYGYVGWDYFGFIRCKECEQAEVEE